MPDIRKNPETGKLEIQEEVKVGRIREGLNYDVISQGSRQVNVQPSVSVSGATYYINNVPTVGPGVTAGIKTKKALLRELERLSHSHGQTGSMQIGTNNCDCACACDCMCSSGS